MVTHIRVCKSPAPGCLVPGENLTILFFLATPGHMEFLGQGSELSHSCNLSCSYSNARSLTHYAWPGIKPASQGSQDAANLLAPERELPFSFSFLFFLKT